MTVGEILAGSFRLVTDHAALLVPIAVLVYLPLAAVPLLIADDPTELGLETALVLWLVSSLAAPVVSGAVTHAIGEVYRGRSVTIAGALQLGTSLLPRLAGVWLLASLAVVAGLVLLVVPGIYLALVFMITTQVVVFEGVGGTKALRRSRVLMRHNLGRAFVLALAGFVVTAVVGGVFELLEPSSLLAALANGILQAIGMAWFSALLVLLYLDVRSRRETFDIEHLERVANDPPAAASLSPA